MRSDNTAVEAMVFVVSFEKDYVATRLNFVTERFMGILRLSWEAVKLLFVYLYLPRSS